MKRFTCLTLSLLMLLSMAGCASPAPCGHQWQQASCTAPETCALCGESTGDVLPHSYGAWQPDGEEMFRSCTLCSTEERAPAEHELILNSLLQGVWDLASVGIGDTVLDAYSTQDEDIAAIFVRFFGEPSEKYVCNAEYVSNGVHPIPIEYVSNGVTVTEYEVVKFLAWEQDGENCIYSFALGDRSILSGENIWFAMHFRLVLTPGKEPVLICESSYEGVDYKEVFTRNDELAAFAEGEWCAVYPGWDDYDASFRLTLNADRTVTGNIDGQLRGAWSVRPLIKDEASGKYKFGIAVLCFSDGFIGGFTPMSGGEIIWVGDSPEELSGIRKEDIRLHLNHEDEILDVFPAGLIDEPEKYRTESKENRTIEGKWNSSLMSGVNILYYGMIESQPELPAENRAACYSNDNTLEILPDGTFIANVREGEQSGTWEKREAPDYLQQHHAAAFYEQLEYYTLTSSNGEKFDAELCCFGKSASLHLSLHEGPVAEIGYNRLSPLKYVFTRALD